MDQFKNIQLKILETFLILFKVKNRCQSTYERMLMIRAGFIFQIVCLVFSLYSFSKIFLSKQVRRYQFLFIFCAGTIVCIFFHFTQKCGTLITSFCALLLSISVLCCIFIVFSLSNRARGLLSRMVWLLGEECHQRNDQSLITIILYFIDGEQSPHGHLAFRQEQIRLLSMILVRLFYQTSDIILQISQPNLQICLFHLILISLILKSSIKLQSQPCVPIYQIQKSWIIKYLFYQIMHQGSLPILDRKQRSITQTLSPLFRKNTGIKAYHSEQRTKNQLSIQVIQNQYSNLNNAMDNLQSTLHKRMGYHQIELLEIMKLEIQRMLDDVKKAVSNYNQMIKEKNFSQDLWETKNQVQYFKYQAFKLFQQNKNLRQEILRLKKQIQQFTFNQQCQKFALKKMAKRLAKQKAQHNSMSANHLGIKVKNKKEDKKKFDTGEIRVQNEEDQKQTIPKRRRHDSLYSCIAKISQNGLSTTPRIDQRKHHSYIESTISHTNERKVFKTQIQNLDGDIKQDKNKGYSGRINLLSIPDRAEKLKKLKQRNSFNKNLSNLQINNINKMPI